MENTTTDNVFNIKLCQSEDSLKLSTDALLLSAYMRRQSKDTAVEFGAGNGVISLLAAGRTCFKKIHAVEVQNELFEIMKTNVLSNGFEDIITPVCADVREVNPELFKGASVIFCNPPYMKTDSGKASKSTSRQIARHEVFGGVADFISAAAKILKTGGKIYIVYRPDRLQTLMSAFAENGFSPKRMTFVHASKDHSPSSVICEAALGGGEQLKITRPLFLNENGCESADCIFIYKNGVFPEEFF